MDCFPLQSFHSYQVFMCKQELREELGELSDLSCEALDVNEEHWAHESPCTCINTDNEAEALNEQCCTIGPL